MSRYTRGQRGQALVMVLAFMTLAVPLIVAALALSSSLSVDSQIKTGILKRQYSLLGASQHALYRLRYETGYAEGLPVSEPSTYTVDLNNRPVTVTVQKHSQPPSSLSPPNADSSRRLQTTKGGLGI